ncbi:MAG: cytochrome c [Proteobacteria bacterium]|nr:cytochrome c [Pseudomonadota bacterium]MBU1234234.1 cytochrome c [Pseudomonadota bacterium]MBU1419062.1 cytochrome c [Pseudomonadota bacterium]MBU1454537.1 cytochrome c [Pseudomonadota bacterium]
MKRVVSALAAGLVFLAVQNVQAFNPQGGNALWGKYAIQTCRSCHKEKGLTALDPQERSREQWEAIFADDYKKLREMSHDFSAVGINDRQLENIYRYLVETSTKNASVTEVAAVPVTKTKKTTAAAQSPAATTKQEADKKFDPDAGDAGKGRYIFRKCLNCHKKNKLVIISPGDRTKKAWSRYFANDFKKFKRAMPEFDTYGYSVAQMEHLHQFVLKYALDADKPKTCE